MTRSQNQFLAVTASYSFQAANKRSHHHHRINCKILLVVCITAFIYRVAPSSFWHFLLLLSSFSSVLPPIIFSFILLGPSSVFLHLLSFSGMP
jgi:hypothetical protein